MKLTPAWTTHSLWIWSLLTSYQIPLVYILVRLSFTADHPTHQHQHRSAMQKVSARKRTKSLVDLGCDMMDGFDSLLYRLRQRERKRQSLKEASQVWCGHLTKLLCSENDCVQGRRSKEGFWSSLKEAYWLTARRWIDLYGVHGNMMDFFPITTIPEGQESREGGGWIVNHKT